MKDFLITTINFMKNYKSLSHILCTIIAINIAIASTFTSCVKADDTLGGNLVPNDKEMVVGTASLDRAELFETSLYQTDSINVGNLTMGYIGSMYDDTVGLRMAGFISQFRSEEKVDSGYFGYRPIIDSIALRLNIVGSASDSTTVQRFRVYEVKDNKFMTETTDTVFYLNFDPTKYIDTDPNSALFTFDYPNSTGNVLGGAISVNLVPTEKGLEFIKRLMITNGEEGGAADPKVDYDVYESTELWFNTFKGLYILPERPDWTESKGSVFTFEIGASGFWLYSRNRDIDDPTLIKDTLHTAYRFSDFYESRTLITVNTVTRDYQGSEINIADAVESNKDRPASNEVYVDGMGGVMTEIKFGKAFFDAVEAIIVDANTEKKEDYRSIAFNRAEMKFYFSAADYNWENIVASQIYPLMDGSMTRLGLYTDFKDLTGVIDYNYAYEISSETALAYSGYINRSQGCYTLNICAYLQSIWNSYLKQKESGTINYDEIENSTVYLAPEAYDLFTTKHSKLQGKLDSDGKQNTMKIDLIYTLIK